MKADMIRRLFEHWIGPMRDKVLLMIGRGVLAAVDSSKDIQLSSVTLLADETKDKTEMIQHFGFTSHPPKGSDVIFLSLGGNRDHGIIIGTESRDHRLKGLNEGDSALYNISGKYLWLKGENLEGLVEKIEINNSNHELISVLVEYFERARDELTVTAIGPQPHTQTSITNLTATIDKLKTFKV